MADFTFEEKVIKNSKTKVDKILQKVNGLKIEEMEELQKKLAKKIEIRKRIFKQMILDLRIGERINNKEIS